MRLKKQLFAILLVFALTAACLPQSIYASYTECNSSGVQTIKVTSNYAGVVEYGGDVTLEVYATYLEGYSGTLTYQWYMYDKDYTFEDEIKLEKATSASYTAKNVTEYNYYRCIVTDTASGYQGQAIFEVYPDSGLTLKYCDGFKHGANNIPYGTKNVVLTVDASVTDGSESKLTYQWYKETYIDNYTSKIKYKIKGATSASYTVSEITDHVGYVCYVYDQYGVYKFLTYMIYPDNGLTVERNEGSREQSVAPGESITLSVKAGITGSAGKDTLTYKWTEKTFRAANNSTAETVIDGATSDSLTFQVEEYKQYTCYVKDQYGRSGSQVFRVWQDSGLTLVKSVVTENPTEGGDVTVKVDATVTSGSVTYQWCSCENGYYSPEVISGATDSTYTIKNVNDNSVYRCYVTDSYGYYTDKAFYGYQLLGHPYPGNSSDSSSSGSSSDSSSSGSGSDSSSSGSGSTGSGSTGITSTGSGSTGSVSTGSTSTGSGNTGNESNGNTSTGSGSAGSTSAGNESTGSAAVVGGDSTSGSAAVSGSAASGNAAVNGGAAIIVGSIAVTGTDTAVAADSVDAAGDTAATTTESTADSSAAGSTQATTTASGKVKSAAASVSKTVKTTGGSYKVTLTAANIKKLTKAAGTSSVDVTLKACDSTGKQIYKLLVNTKNLKAGKKLYAYKYNSKTGKYTKVRSKAYTVSGKGSISFSTDKKGTYVLVTAKEAKKLNK